MGMDGVELVLQVEEQFGISLTDEEAAAVLTPAQLIDLVISKKSVEEQASCPTQRAFHLLRAAFRRISGVKNLSLSLDSQTAAVCGSIPQREVWLALQKELGIEKWPEMERPEWMVNTAAVGCLLLAAVLFPALGWASVIPGIFAGAFLHAATQNQKRCVPNRYKTVRQLACLACAAPCIDWNRAYVADRVRGIVLETLDLKPDKYREDALFVKDLGMD